MATLNPFLEPPSSGTVLPDGSQATTSDIVWDAYQRAVNAGLYQESADGLQEWLSDQYILEAEEVG